LVEGLFGILPDALKGELMIKPGFPSSWNHASISMPDITIDFKRKGKEDTYTIVPAFAKKMRLNLLVKANGSAIQSVTVNGKKTVWKNNEDFIETPMIVINAGIQTKYEIKITWSGKKTVVTGVQSKYINGDKLTIQFPGATVRDVADPQKVLTSVQRNNDRLTGIVNVAKGHYTFFVLVKQDDLNWWEPISIVVKDAVEIIAPFNQSKNDLTYTIINNTSKTIKGEVIVNTGANAFIQPLELKADHVYNQVNIGAEHVIPGTNTISLSWEGATVHQQAINWNAEKTMPTAQALDLSQSYNDKVTNIFKNQYLSPRPNVATLQLPTQGIGDWTHPLKTANIDDKGLRGMADKYNRFTLPQGVPFFTPADSTKPNILFTSQWDNYPKEATLPLTGKASHAYLLMAGSTNPMQSRVVNGAVIIMYTDNTADTLLLENPQTWWPIEQDYMDDGFAFKIGAPRPVRIHLKTGKIVSEYDKSIEAYSGKMIDGGAATVLDMPLNATKTLKELKLQAIANDVVVGLMALTLIR
jgi:hypothetical protein